MPPILFANSDQPDFTDLGVPFPLVEALTRAGKTSAFPIQADTLPDTLAVHVVHCGVPRRLDDSAYAQRADECRQAAERIGPLAIASLASLKLR